jgi:hypothetical protein
MPGHKPCTGLAQQGGAHHRPVSAGVPIGHQRPRTGGHTAVWQGLFALAGTPQAIIDKLGAGMGQVGRAADLAEKWRSYGGELVGNTPEQFAAFLKTDRARWSAVVKRANVKLD